MLEGIYCRKLKLAKENKEFNLESYRDVASRLLKGFSQENVDKAQRLVNMSNETEREINELDTLSKELGCK